MQLKLQGELGRKNVIIRVGFQPELKVIRKSVKDPNKLISLLFHYSDLLLNGKLLPESAGLTLGEHVQVCSKITFQHELKIQEAVGIPVQSASLDLASHSRLIKIHWDLILSSEVSRILVSVELCLLRFGSEMRLIICKTKLHQVSQLVNVIHNFLPNPRNEHV